LQVLNFLSGFAMEYAVAEEQGAGEGSADDGADNVEDLSMQTDMTGEDICQLNDVLGQYVVEIGELKEKLENRPVHTEEYYRQKPDRVKFYTGLANLCILLGVV
jgi:hypothetical protein